jgi:hypothetical protein
MPAPNPNISAVRPNSLFMVSAGRRVAAYVPRLIQRAHRGSERRWGERQGHYSGGKDSQATLIELLRLGVPRGQIVVVHASLGEAEWPGALEHAQQHAEAVVTSRGTFTTAASVGWRGPIAARAKRLEPASAPSRCSSESPDDRGLLEPHKHCFSVRERGRVVAHTDRIALVNAHFVVQRSGYERTVRERVRCVHAWVRGEVTEMPNTASSAQALVTYNPFCADHFRLLATGERIDSAPS